MLFSTSRFLTILFYQIACFSLLQSSIQDEKFTNPEGEASPRLKIQGLPWKRRYFTRSQIRELGVFVDDMQEYIGTLGCRLSPEHYEQLLNSRKRSDSVVVLKPCNIRSRVSRIDVLILTGHHTHYLRLRGIVLF